MFENLCRPFTLVTYVGQWDFPEWVVIIESNWKVVQLRPVTAWSACNACIPPVLRSQGFSTLGCVFHHCCGSNSEKALGHRCWSLKTWKSTAPVVGHSLTHLASTNPRPYIGIEIEMNNSLSQWSEIRPIIYNLVPHHVYKHESAHWKTSTHPRAAMLQLHSCYINRHINHFYEHR